MRVSDYASRSGFDKMMGNFEDERLAQAILRVALPPLKCRRENGAGKLGSYEFLGQKT
jgi:hypothetical protein